MIRSLEEIEAQEKELTAEKKALSFTCFQIDMLESLLESL